MNSYKKRIMSAALSLSFMVTTPYGFIPAKAEDTVNADVVIGGDLTVTDTIVIENDMVFDLKGYTITRDSSNPGSVFYVKEGATLTIIDSSAQGNGKITGGKALMSDEADYDPDSSYGGNAYIDDTDTCGGGVYVENGAKLIMAGGSITGNCAEQGGGVFLEGDAELHISGTASIKDNYSGDDVTVQDNVWLPLDDEYTQSRIIVDGKLAETAEIGVTLAVPVGIEPVVFSSGLSGNGSEDSFFSDEKYAVVLNEDNEACLSAIGKLPESRTGLIYNGSQQKLITAGTAAEGYTFEYAVTSGKADTAPSDGWIQDAEKVTKSIPGDYKVWCRLVSDDATEPVCSLDVAIAKIAPKSSGKIMTKDMIEVDFTGKYGKYHYTGGDLANFEYPLTVKADTEFTVIMTRKTAFTYFDGIEEVIPAQETKNEDGTYTYRFTMPGFDVEHSSPSFSIIDNTKTPADQATYDSDPDNYTGKWNSYVTSEIDGEGPDEDDQYNKYFESRISLVSEEKLEIGFHDDETGDWTEIPFECVKTENGKYSYTFSMPYHDTELNIYRHSHDYELEVKDNQLIRTCTKEDEYCLEDNKPRVIAELVNIPGEWDDAAEAWKVAPSAEKELVYDGTSRNVWTEGINADVVFYLLDPEDGTTTRVDEVPSNAGTYMASADVEYDGKSYTLTLPYEITPAELTEDNVVYDNHNDYDNKNEDGSFGRLDVPNADSFTAGKIQYADFHMNFRGTDLVKNKDYYVIGTESTRRPGTYIITIDGTGNFTGSTEVEWTLHSEAKQEITKDMVAADHIISGKYAYASVTVTDRNGNVLEEGRDYILGGTTRTNEGGTFTVEIEGKGNYYGSVDAEWSVLDVDITGKFAFVKNVKYDSSTKMLSFISRLAIPSGATMKAAGICATTDSSLIDNLSVADIGKDNVWVRSKKDDEVSPYTGYTFTWNKTNVAPGAVWYGRPYVIYVDENGNEQTCYGELVKATAGNNNYEVIPLGTAVVKSTSYNSDNRMLSIVNRLTIPEGCTMTAAGLVATDVEKDAEAIDKNNAKYFRTKNGKDVAPYSAYKMTWNKTNVSSGDIWYVKPYVAYIDADGAEHEVYGELIVVTA